MIPTTNIKIDLKCKRKKSSILHTRKANCINTINGWIKPNIVNKCISNDGLLSGFFQIWQWHVSLNHCLIDRIKWCPVKCAANNYTPKCVPFVQRSVETVCNEFKKRNVSKFDAHNEWHGLKSQWSCSVRIKSLLK